MIYTIINDLPKTDNWDCDAHQQIIYLPNGTDNIVCSSSQLWLDFAISEYNIKVWAGYNDGEARSGTVVITYEGTDYEYIVNQGKSEQSSSTTKPTLKVTLNKYTVDYNGDTVTAILTYNNVVTSTSCQNKPSSTTVTRINNSTYTITIPKNTTGGSYSFTFVGTTDTNVKTYDSVTIIQTASVVSYTLSVTPLTLSYTSKSESHTLSVTSTKNDNGTTENLGWSISGLPSWIDQSNLTTTGITLTTNTALTSTSGGNAIITQEESGWTRNVALTYKVDSGSDTPTLSSYAYTGCSTSYPTTVAAIEAGQKNTLSSSTNTLKAQAGGNYTYWVAIPSQFYLIGAQDNVSAEGSLQDFWNTRVTVGDYTVYYHTNSGMYADGQTFTFTESSNPGTGTFTVKYYSEYSVNIGSEQVSWGNSPVNIPKTYIENETTYTITSWIVDPTGKTIVADARFVVKESVEGSASEAKTYSVLSATYADDDF